MFPRILIQVRIVIEDMGLNYGAKGDETFGEVFISICPNYNK
jgi:hypothetical protein